MDSQLIVILEYVLLCVCSKNLFDLLAIVKISIFSNVLCSQRKLGLFNRINGVALKWSTSVAKPISKITASKSIYWITGLGLVNTEFHNEKGTWWKKDPIPPLFSPTPKPVCCGMFNIYIS